MLRFAQQDKLFDLFIVHHSSFIVIKSYQGVVLLNGVKHLAGSSVIKPGYVVTPGRMLRFAQQDKPFDEFIVHHSSFIVFNDRHLRRR